MPKFQNDCEQCTFIETSPGPYENREEVDWYVCGPTKETVIWRCSSEPSDNGAVDMREPFLAKSYPEAYAILEKFQKEQSEQ